MNTTIRIVTSQAQNAYFFLRDRLILFVIHVIKLKYFNATCSENSVKYGPVNQISICQEFERILILKE